MYLFIYFTYNWSADVKHICGILNIEDVFDNPTCTVIDNVADKLGIVDEKEMVGLCTLRTYVLFKKELKTENYVKYYMHKRKRSLVALLLLGILPLRIETGRYK